MKIFFTLAFLSLLLPPSTTELPPLHFEKLDDRTTLITASYLVDEQLVPANYLILEGDSFSILLDTPWDNDQTEELLDWAEESLDHPIKAAIITHSHIDRMGGIAALHERNIETYIHPKAQEMNAESESPYEAATHLIAEEQTFQLGKLSLKVVYPGDGHAPGNLIVQIGRHGIYGGCFLKSASSRTLGYTGDANLEEWKKSLVKIAPLVENATWVIPGHGPIEAGAYERTVELVNMELDK